jgi:tetratricopeptide (TPR) repeat protein
MIRRYASLLLVLMASASLLAASDSSDSNPNLSAAEQLYRSGKFSEAASQYQTILKTDPKLIPAQVGLVRSELHQDQVDDAFAAATTYLAAEPNSAPLLAAMGDVQFRLGEMSEAEISYRNALKADPKQVQAHLGLARLYRSYSLYRHAYDELVLAHQIAPEDPDVQRRWWGHLSRQERIAAIEGYLAGPHPDSAKSTQHLRNYLEFLKATVDKPVHACRLVNHVEQTETKLESMVRGQKHQLAAYGMVVKLNDHSARLILDTGATGILVNRRTAEKAGLTRISDTSIGGIGDKGEQSAYIAVAEHIRVGELEFQDCLVSVSDRVSVTDEDGLIGSDVFASYLIDLDLPNQKIELSPLPTWPDEAPPPATLNSQGESQASTDNEADAAEESKADNSERAEPKKPASEKPASAKRLPHDRYIAPGMEHWTPVFRMGHALLIPTHLDNSPSMLFLIDTGSDRNVLAQRASKLVTRTSLDPSTRVAGLNGEVSKVYRSENATLVFGHLAQRNQTITTYDLSHVSRAFGTEISGILGFELLRMLQVKIDYRDGLVDFVYDAKRWGTGK